MASITYFKQIDEKFWDIIKKELNVKELEVMTGSFKDKEDLFVELDTKMTPELEAEGYARNVIRSIQAFRKKLGLKQGEDVKTVLIVDKKLKEMLDKHKNTVADKTNSKVLDVVTESKETFKNKTDFKVKDMKGEVAIIL